MRGGLRCASASRPSAPDADRPLVREGRSTYTAPDDPPRLRLPRRAPGPDLDRFAGELDLIEKSYVQYLGLTQALRLSQPKFMEQFRRMLMSKLRVVFENASAEMEMWNKSASAQVDAQLRERRRGFRRRRESLERIQAAASELETRLGELDSQDQRLQGFEGRCGELLDALRQQARTGTRGEMATMITIDLPLDDEPAPPQLRLVKA